MLKCQLASGKLIAGLKFRNLSCQKNKMLQLCSAEEEAGEKKKEKKKHERWQRAATRSPGIGKL